MSERLLPSAMAAARLGIVADHLRKLVKQGKIPAYSSNSDSKYGKRLFFKPSDLKEYAETRGRVILVENQN